jgi:hypothetical protein
MNQFGIVWTPNRHPRNVLVWTAEQQKLQVNPSKSEVLSDGASHHSHVETASTNSDIPAEVISGWPHRYMIVGLCFVAFMLCNMDRVNMSIAILPMQQEFQWSSQTVGIVQSSFFWYVILASYAS